MVNRMIFANVLHRPIRTVVSVLAVAIEVGMVMLVVGMTHGLVAKDSMASSLRTRAVNSAMRWLAKAGIGSGIHFSSLGGKPRRAGVSPTRASSQDGNGRRDADAPGAVFPRASGE